ncbi:MAG: DUF3179 domain-containing protein [Lewinellaceae bacterium]|nr:DUF3179 domain-containing protein [Lewinellaceae bacterium]
MRQIYGIVLALFVLTLPNCHRQEEPTNVLPDGDPQTRVKLIEDRVNGQDILVVGEPDMELYAAFLRPSGGPGAFHAVQGKLPVVLADSEGTRYDIWGTAVSGPGKGGQLVPANFMIAYWFAWGAQYPGCALYGHPDTAAPAQPPGENGWLIPYSRLARGAFPGAIPSIDAPEYIEHLTDYMPYLEDDTRCLVVRMGADVFAYPHPVLEWHEVVNDRQGGTPFSVLYCPLTGSGCAWRREYNGAELEYEVSGLLYNSNLIAEDRTTGSYWSQMRHEAVGGQLVGQKTTNIEVLEVPFATARRLFGRVKILSDRTGYPWEYGNFPCGDYCTNHDLILYPLVFKDDRVPGKERTLGVLVDGQAKVYRLTAFE